MIAEWIVNRELVRTDSGDVIDAESLASQIGLIKAIKDYDLKRMISFHSRVNRAELFASEVHDAIDFICSEHRPDGEIWADFVSGAMPTHQRRLKLDQLKELTKGDRGLLSNARCLSEGVDVPSLDGVAFIDPKGSQVDIVQAVGRAIRLSKNKSVGTIVLPVFIEEGNDPEESIQNSNFKPVWGVLNALKSHDEVLSFELDQLRTEMGRTGGRGVVGGIPRVVFDLPRTVDSSFADSLKTFLVKQTTSSWSFWFGLLESYVEQECHSRVSQDYVTEDGYKLGLWVSNQRSIEGTLTIDQKERLESLEGWVWNVLEFQWEQGFSYLKAYIEKEGHAIVPKSFKTEDEFKLGSWVSKQRSRKDEITHERITRLESLDGWVWDILGFQWEQRFSYLETFIEQEGHALVPVDYKTEDGYKLGGWVSDQRTKKDQLTLEQIKQLELLEGWAWDVLEFKWEEGLSYLKKYVQQEGHARVSQNFETECGYSLGQWVSVQRVRFQERNLTEKQVIRVESIEGWVWNVLEFQWEQGFSYLKAYIEKEGHAIVPKSFKTEDEFKLGSWVNDQRSRKNRLILEKIKRLESLGRWVWDALDAQWEEGFSYLEEYSHENGCSRVPISYKTRNGFKLGNWVFTQRQSRKKETLINERIKRLDALEFDWNPNVTLWEEGFSYLKEYFHENDSASVPVSFKTRSGFKLGTWVDTTRQSKKNKKLTQDQVERLETLEFEWDPHATLWEEGFSYCEEYSHENGSACVPVRFKTKSGFKLGSWVSKQRSKKDKLTSEQIKRLELLEGWVWCAVDARWEEGFSYLEAYVEQKGHAGVIQSYKAENDFKLGGWVSRQRSKKDQLTPEQIKRLESLGGWVWDASNKGKGSIN
jgi:hypothetical protein